MRGRLNNKAYIGEVVHPGESYNIQRHFKMEGVFSIKVTPLGANLCLLEDLEEGFLVDMLGDGCT